MEIRLLVIRTGNLKQLSEFYGELGLVFDYHKHGNSPFHYSASVGQAILEIYPLAKNQREADSNLRLGFAIKNFDETIIRLKALNTTFSIEPTQTEFGYMAVITDPDGRKIEIYKK